MEFSRSCLLFLASFGKFNSLLGMEHNGKLYGFSAVKLKFIIVDSLI